MNLLTLVAHTLQRASTHNRSYTIYRLAIHQRATNQETFIVRTMSTPAPDPCLAQIVMTIHPCDPFNPHEEARDVLQDID